MLAFDVHKITLNRIFAMRAQSVIASYLKCHKRVNMKKDLFEGFGINCSDEEIFYTRIAEHKHFTPWEEHDQKVCLKEYSQLIKGSNTPYYLPRLEKNLALLKNYAGLVEKKDTVNFIRRFGTYRYLDMHVVIGESLDLAKSILAAPEKVWVKFNQNPLGA